MTIYRLFLTEDERQTLELWVKKGKSRAKKVQYAQILLNSDENVERKSGAILSEIIGVSVKTIERVRRTFCEEGLVMFEPKERKTRSDKKIDGRVEAHLATLLCQCPPHGETEMATKNAVGEIDRTRSGRTYFHDDGRKADKKNDLKPFQKKQWVIPADKSAAFVHQLEQVLSSYERPYDVEYPLVCMDESPKQIIDYREFTGSDGKRHQDSEYIRKGVVELFVATEPLAGFRELSVENDHKSGTWVKFIARLMDTTSSLSGLKVANTNSEA